VTPLLQAKGHVAIAQDLPGMGDDRSIPVETVTLADWARSVADAVRSVPSPVFLVGHSRGGLVIGDAAELACEDLQGLVYVTAVIVPPGLSIMDTVDGNTAARAAEPAARQQATYVADAASAAVFYDRCTPADAAWAISRLCLEPRRVLTTPTSATWARWGKVPRAYIECALDSAVPLERQRKMQAAAPCQKVAQLQSDHSPFLCVPEQLADALITIADAFAAGSPAQGRA
jgi:pimeloyl-ACP methyl ester carboxylesterase